MQPLLQHLLLKFWPLFCLHLLIHAHPVRGPTTLGDLELTRVAVQLPARGNWSDCGAILCPCPAMPPSRSLPGVSTDTFAEQQALAGVLLGVPLWSPDF